MSYKKQSRGNSKSYQNYYKSMDQVMAQKLAFVTAQFPLEGTILDMGSGSGKGTFDLANLFPKAKVIGVDISKESIKYSQKEYKKENLSFIQGDVSKKLFSKNSIDAILNSSVIHHVTSFNKFEKNKVLSLLKNQTSQLKENGILCIRDFLAPESNEQVYLTLSNEDGDESENIRACSTSKLFKIFLKQFKCSLYPHSNIPLKVVRENLKETTFQIELQMANEFLLRKDYRDSWESEILEEYAYFNKKQFEEAFEKVGLEIVFSKPIYNQWIINNRWKGKINLTTLGGTPIYLPTNYVILGKNTKRKPITYEKKSLKPTSFLKKEFFVDKNDYGWELISREKQTVDLIPYFIDKNNQLMVLCREGYPRPIIKTNKEPRLDEAKVSEYIIEPISFIVDNFNLKNIKDQLKRRIGININKVTKGLSFFPSPGGTGEKVRSFYLLINEVSEIEQNNLSGFEDCGKIKALPAQQLIRSFQTGAMSDSRLEVSIYHLMNSIGASLDPWIEERIKKEDLFLNKKSKFSLINKKQFVLSSKKEFNYLKHEAFEFFDGKNKVYLESVSVKDKSLNTVSVVPVTKNKKGELLVGLEKRSFPVVEKFNLGSEILTNPAWRVPREYNSQTCFKFVKQSLEDMGCAVLDLFPLGGNYYPSCALSCENVMPLVAITSPSDKFLWVPLKSLSLDKILDGHLLTIIARLKHQNL